MTQETILHRQVHPNWVTEDGVSSLVFKPTPKDAGKLSVYDGDQYSAEEAFDNYTGKGLSSAGVLGVSHKECDDETLPCIPDNATFAGHVLIDYSAYEKKDIERKAKKLRDLALHRNWLHKKPLDAAPEEDTSEELPF